MTRDELMAEISAELHMNAAAPLGDYGKGRFEALEEVLRRLEQLDSPPAMTWQDEPSATGLHYVEGLSVPVLLIRDANRPDRPWTYWDAKYSRSERVGSRRVCPIPSPPELTKRGDA